MGSDLSGPDVGRERVAAARQERKKGKERDSGKQEADKVANKIKRSKRRLTIVKRERKSEV